MLDRIRKQKQEKVAEKLPSGPLKVCEKKHGGNAMEGGEDQAGVCSPAGKLGFGRGNSTRGPAVCRGASNKYKSVSLGLGPFDPSVLPTRGVSVLSGVLLRAVGH